MMGQESGTVRVEGGDLSQQRAQSLNSEASAGTSLSEGHSSSAEGALAAGRSTSSASKESKAPLPRTFVAVNVGTLAYRLPTAGAAAHGIVGVLSRVPNPNMNRLLEWMQLEDKSTNPRQKLVACFLLSSTCLPRTDVQRAVIDFASVGYDCQESHGVSGLQRREIAGVMICIATGQLRFLRVGNIHRYKRVVRRGRIIRSRLGVVGAPDRSSDLHVLLQYMPPRGSGARGFSDPAKKRLCLQCVGQLYCRGNPAGTSAAVFSQLGITMPSFRSRFDEQVA